MKRTTVHSSSPTKLLRSILTQRGPQLWKWSFWLSSWRNFQHFLGRQKNSQNLHTDLNFEVHPSTSSPPLPKSEKKLNQHKVTEHENRHKVTEHENRHKQNVQKTKNILVKYSEHCPSCLTFFSHSIAEEFSTKY